ncbi:MAG: polysaccharide biosynthesis protein, partial [Phormidesmis sp.]
MKYYRSLNIFLANFALRRRRRSRQIILKVLDTATFCLSIYLAISIRFETLLPPEFAKDKLWQVLVLIAIQSFTFYAVGIYRSILRYSSLTLIKNVAQAVALSALLLIALTYFGGDWALTRSVLIVNALLVLVFSVSIRLLLRWLIRTGLSHSERQILPERSPERLIVYGAGAAGVELLNALHYSPCYEVIGFVDDDIDLQKRASIEGLNIYAPSQLSTLWQENWFDSVVLAMPSISITVRRRIITTLKQQSISVKTVPALGSILSGKVTIQELRDVEITDLLGRAEVAPDLELLQRQIKNKSVLVTGAGGSIGSELCRQIIQQQPSYLVLYERHEFALYKIHQELVELSPDTRIVPCLGSVTDGPSLRSVLKENCVETVYHTAAYKHVPLLESNISRAIENNVLGTLTVAQSSIETGVRQFVLISTDKAVRPTNIKGTTKRIGELIVQALSAQAPSLTRCAIVRFGNVLGSSGSVVPRFRHQIA